MTLEEMNAFMFVESLKHTSDFVDLPKEHWVHKWENTSGTKPFRVLRNKSFFVQLYRHDGGIIRITVNRPELKSIGRWVDGITWDELHDIKTKIGYGHRDAVEIYPKEHDVVNDANMRHLWVLPEHGLNFIWRSK